MTMAMRDVQTERERQDAKWGEQNHALSVWVTILAEEVGELAHEILVGRDIKAARKEAIQCAAVAVAIVECIDRAKPPADRPPEEPPSVQSGPLRSPPLDIFRPG